MTKSEYQKLVEFIAPQFDRMNKRFTAVDKRFDEMDDRLRRVEILGEDTRHQVQILAEAVSDTVSKDTFEAFRSEVAAGFEGLRELLRAEDRSLGLIPILRGGRLGDLPDLLEAAPRLSDEEAEALGRDVHEGRDSLPELSDEDV